MESILENKNHQLSLKWSGFTENIISSLGLSLGNQDFVDVTLVCEGGSIKAHRLVLSACSSFFQGIFKENVCPHPVVVLKGIALCDLETLMMFIYHGEARTFEENVPQLLEAAQFLEIRGLCLPEHHQVSPDIIPNEPTEPTSRLKISSVQSGVHSTTQEFSLLTQTEVFNQRVRTTSPGNYENECQDKQIEILETDIKREPLEAEEEKSIQPDSICRQTVPLPLPTQNMSKNKLEDQSFCVPRSNFSVQEMQVLQQQRKLAFYEPRPCPKCHRMYRDAATLRNHLTSMHEVLRHKVPCSCGSLFPTKHDLYVHRKRDHKGSEKCP